MKKIALLLTLMLIATPVLAQKAEVTEVAPPAAAAADGTVRQGPLFLGGFMDKIKESFGRKPADPVPQPRAATATPPTAHISPSTNQILQAKAQREAQAAANLARNRQIAAAISAAADRDVALMAQEIERERALQAARAAGVSVPSAPAAAAGAAPTAPVRVIDGTQKPAAGNKPIFNNYR